MLSVQTNTEQDNTASVTNISATARIDYIQRFSKQAVLVVHEDYQVSADIGHQYIAQLPPQSNTAFVSVSSKHNDIQIRCRIVEQLFTQQAFDPEVSLAVSLINQLKAEPQKLTIVIANAHHLSLQLLHELTQLCEVAKKSDCLISVLMLSNIEAGKTVALHKDLFAKKLSILAADSGQLVSINDASLKAGRNQFLSKTLTRWLLIFSTLFAIGAAIIFALTQIEVNNSVAESVDKQNTFIELKTSDEAVESNATADTVELASTQDILAALSGEAYQPETVKNKAETVNPASTHDILNAVLTNEESTQEAVNESTDEAKIESTTGNITQRETELALAAALDPIQMDLPIASNQQQETHSYYQGFAEGFVIQVGNFSQLTAVESMKESLSNSDFYYYVRKRGGQDNWVLTSQVFGSREEADQAKNEYMTLYPNGSFWTRSLASIHADIDNYQATSK